MDRRTAGAVRGAAVRGAVVAVHDAGGVQTVDVETHDGILRTGIEVLQPFGVAGQAPAGGYVLLIAIGGDQGDMLALPVAHPGARMGGFAAGQAALYDAMGNRVACLNNGVIEIHASVRVRILAPEVEIEAPGGVSIIGDVAVTGNITATGTISDATGSMDEMRGTYNSHGHTGAGTSAPIPLMD
ncbi:phage baseplate assembly protein domain-containing protein [Humitalea sp. 24SJ18S-53]|uniref:phage baseplate assembly protein domain-containing protein n=1 Tax=Humitalea sp. 24SJ18S-53 TaxID=3422307 RepID=UPI003D6744A2